MKTNFIFIALFVLSFSQLFGKIRNGYETELLDAKESLRILTSLLLEDRRASYANKQRIKSEIENLVNHISCYELTQELLYQFRNVSPGMCTEIDNIKDKRGRSTDVYVRFITKNQSKLPFRAASFFGQASVDEDANLSRYGEYSVAVEICITEKSLLLLSHELGHVKYIVPNLASFHIFYNKNYVTGNIAYHHMGHGPRDQSGKYAEAFEKKFCKDYKFYLRNGGEKLQSPFSILRKAKKDVRDQQTDLTSKTLASIMHH
jgi:hypothetical protein